MCIRVLLADDHELIRTGVRCLLEKIEDVDVIAEAADGAEAQELNPPDLRPLQDSELVDTERRNAVQRAIGTLPEKYRAPLILRDVDGRSYDEIARILETSEGTVKSRISRARGFLREKMRAYL